jgi:hypothetical protein
VRVWVHCWMLSVYLTAFGETLLCWFEFGTSVDMVHVNGVSEWLDVARDIHLAWIRHIYLNVRLCLQTSSRVTGKSILLNSDDEIQDEDSDGSLSGLLRRCLQILYLPFDTRNLRPIGESFGRSRRSH